MSRENAREGNGTVDETMDVLATEWIVVINHVTKRDQTSLLPGSPAPEMAVVDELSPTPGPLVSFPSLFVPVDFKSSFDEAF